MPERQRRAHLPLVVGDEHGGVALHDDIRESLETTPEVSQRHVLWVAWRESERHREIERKTERER